MKTNTPATCSIDRDESTISPIRKTSRAALLLVLGTIIPVVIAGCRQHPPSTTLNAADFGLVADGVTDDGPAIARMLRAAADLGKETPVILRFPEGARIYAQPSPDRYLFRLEGFKEAAIQGGGSVFSLHPDLRFLSASRCMDLKVEDLKVETSPAPTIEAVIVSMNEDGSELTVRLDEPHRGQELGGPTGVDGEQLFFGMIWIPGAQTGTGHHHHYILEASRPLEGEAALVQVSGRDPLPEGMRRHIEPGRTKISLPVPGVAHRHGPGAMMFIDRCVDVQVEDVEIWSAPWFAYQVFRSSGNLVFRRAHIRPEPGSGRITSTWRDGFHVKGNTGNILFEDCILEGMNDDSFNISTHNWRVTRVLDERHFKVSQKFPILIMPLQAGGMLQALSADGQRRLGQSRITKINGLPAEDPAFASGEGYDHPPAPDLEIFVETPIPALETGSILWDATTANPSVTIRGCKIRNACRFQSAVILEGCDIAALVWLYGEDVEGPMPSGSILRNNVFRRGRGNPHLALAIHGALRVAPPPAQRIVPAREAEFPLTDITLENNRFYGGLEADRVHGLVLTGNTFADGLGTSRITDCPDVKLTGNQPDLQELLQRQ